jgi:hypothetical protein
MAEWKGLHERELKRKMFYASLGECITAWATIERELFDLFHRALGIERRWRPKSRRNADREKSALIFWTLPTFGMRLSYTSMLVTYCLETGDGSKSKAQQYWKKLNKDLERLHSFRNKLAHQPTAEDEIVPPTDPDDEGAMIIWAKEMIVPNKLDKRKSFKPIEHADLEAHLKAVLLVRNRLEIACSYLTSWEEIAWETFSDDENEDQDQNQDD